MEDGEGATGDGERTAGRWAAGEGRRGEAPVGFGQKNH